MSGYDINEYITAVSMNESRVAGEDLREKSLRKKEKIVFIFLLQCQSVSCPYASRFLHETFFIPFLFYSDFTSYFNIYWVGPTYHKTRHYFLGQKLKSKI